MMTDRRPPRIAPIADEDRDERTERMFALMMGGDDDPTRIGALRTLARYPGLGQRFLKFNLHLLTKTTLPIRLRQLAILRVGWVRGSDYVWPSHARLSLKLGLAEADIVAVRAGADDPHWSSVERAVLMAVDQLCVGSDVDDAIWAALAAALDDRQLMDFLFTVGCYVTLAMALRTMRVAPDPHLGEFAERFGSPRRETLP